MHSRLLEVAARTQGNDGNRIKNLTNAMYKVAVRWAKLYHAEREQAVERIKELEQEVGELRNGQ